MEDIRTTPAAGNDHPITHALETIAVYRCIPLHTKMSLYSCTKRRLLATQRAPHYPAGSDPYWCCLDCPGATPIDPSLPAPPPNALETSPFPTQTKTYRKPFLCRECGESDPQKFRPWKKCLCMRCLTKYEATIRKRHKINVSTIMFCTHCGLQWSCRKNTHKDRAQLGLCVSCYAKPNVVKKILRKQQRELKKAQCDVRT